MQELNRSRETANPFYIAPDVYSEETSQRFESPSGKEPNAALRSEPAPFLDLGGTRSIDPTARVLDFKSGKLDFSPPTQQAEVKVMASATAEGSLPGLGISHGTDLFLPDVQLLPGSLQSDGEQFSPYDLLADLTPTTVPTTAELPANARIALAAQRNSEGKPWVETKYEPQLKNGRLAGAAAVSMVLQDIGYGYADSANVGTLSSQLEKQGWQKVPLDQAKPGDVIYGGKLGKDWRAGGGNAHVGIVGQDGKVWHNDSATGKWQSDSIADSFPNGKYGNQVWVLRPPQTDIPNVPVPDGPVRPNRPDRPHPPSPGQDNRPRPSDYVPRPDDVTPRPGDDPNIRPEDAERNLESKARILKHAKGSVDKRLWAQSDFANSVKGGRLGCAASVSEVLRAAGFKYANSAGVGGLVGILEQHGWTKVPLSQSQPGDVVFGGKPGTRWWEGGGNAHIGVVGEDRQVFHNSSGKRRWVQDDLTTVFNSKRFGDNRWALRPPSRNG